MKASMMITLALFGGLTSVSFADAPTPITPTILVIRVDHTIAASFAPYAKDMVEVFVYGLDQTVVAARITVRYTAAGTPAQNIQIVSTNGIGMSWFIVADLSQIAVQDVTVEPLVDSVLGVVDAPQHDH